MEGKKRSVKPIGVMLIAIIIIVLDLGIFVEQSGAAFGACFAKCFGFCLLHPIRGIGRCSLKCFKRCHDHPPASDNNLMIKYYCEMGCFSFKCTNISTPQDPCGNEVEGCVNSCSDECVL